MTHDAQNAPELINDKRARFAESTIAHYLALTGGDEENAVSDLVADIAHLCDRKPVYGIFFFRTKWRAAFARMTGKFGRTDRLLPKL